MAGYAWFYARVSMASLQNVCSFFSRGKVISNLLVLS